MSELRGTNLGREEEKKRLGPRREWACSSVTKNEWVKVCVHLCKRNGKDVNEGDEPGIGKYAVT